MDKNIKLYIEEFIKMKEGERISNPEFRVLISNKAQFTKKSLKHFVESRLKSRNSKEEIYYLIDKAPEVIDRPQINILNTNKKALFPLVEGRRIPHRSSLTRTPQQAFLTFTNGNNALFRQSIISKSGVNRSFDID